MPRWETPEVRYRLNPLDSPWSEAETRAVVAAAASVWNDLPGYHPRLVFDGLTTTPAGHFNDGQSVVSFSPGTHPTVPTRAADAMYYYDAQGTLSNADVRVWAGAYRWLRVGEACGTGKIVLQSVLVHEFGHCLGSLAKVGVPAHPDGVHLANSAATMYPKLPGACGKDAITLHADDIRAVHLLYAQRKKIVYFPVRWPEVANAPTMSIETLIKELTKTRDAWLLQSGGRWYLDFDVQPWTDMPGTAMHEAEVITPLYQAWRAKTGLTADVRVYWMQQRPGNPTGGNGVAMMRGSGIGGTLTHELGHAVGLSHASSVTQAGTVVKIDEYGDPDSPMGRGAGHFHPIEKMQLGWLHDPSVVPPPPPRQSGQWGSLLAWEPGEYWIDDYEAQRLRGPKALIVKPGGSVTRAVVNFARGKVRLRSPLIYDLDPVTTAIDYSLDIGQTVEQSFAALWGGPVAYPTLWITPLRLEGTGVVIRVSATAP